MENHDVNIRLSLVSNELNIGILEIIHFLESKGIKVELNPNSKVTSEQYELLKNHFSSKSIKPIFDKYSEPTILGRIQLPIKKSQSVKLNSLSELDMLKERQPKTKQPTITVTSSWKSGKVKFYDSEKGFGFVECFDDKVDCFIHVSKLITPLITDNDYVIFKTVPSQKKGKEGQTDAVYLHKLSLFTSDYSFLEKVFSEHKINSLRNTILEILPIDSVFRIVENELKGIHKGIEKITVAVILQDIQFLLASLKRQELKAGILELIRLWA